MAVCTRTCAPHPHAHNINPQPHTISSIPVYSYQYLTELCHFSWESATLAIYRRGGGAVWRGAAWRRRRNTLVSSIVPHFCYTTESIPLFVYCYILIPCTIRHPLPSTQCGTGRRNETLARQTYFRCYISILKLSI